MSIDKLSQDRFDEMLRQTLKGHSEPVPADFTNRMLRQIIEAQERKILARVVLQERLALAGCIIFSGIVIVAATVFPDIVAAVFRGIATSVTQQGEALTNRIPQTIRAFSSEWQFYTVLGGVLGFAIYSFVELLLGNDLTIA